MYSAIPASGKLFNNVCVVNSVCYRIVYNFVQLGWLSLQQNYNNAIIFYI